MVTSNKQRIQWTRNRRNPQKRWITRDSLAGGADSSKHEVAMAMKIVGIIQLIVASEAVW